MFIIKQISVFVENKPGRIKAMTNILKENNINIRALSIADTKDFGILRLIVNEPEKTCQILKDAECTVTTTDVIAVGFDDKPGQLANVMDTLFECSISVEYMYAFFSRIDGQASVILRVTDNQKAVDELANAGVKLLSCDEIYNN